MLIRAYYYKNKAAISTETFLRNSLKQIWEAEKPKLLIKIVSPNIMLNLMQKAILLILFLISSNSCSPQVKQENKSTLKTTINENHFPKPIGYVNDFALILDSVEIQNLETKLKKYDSQTTNQIAIVTLNNQRLTEGNFDEYAVNLTKVWGVGTKEKNNGLTIVLSPQLRRIRIVTGRATEKILTDKICEEVLLNTIIPEFKNGNYFDGINKAIDEFINRWK